MKNDDLERLENSQDVQQLIHFAKEQYEQEKSEHGSNTQSDQIAVVTTVIDTVVVIHERVDTVYREVHLKSLVATSNAAKSKSASPKKHARQSEAISERSESDFISSALLQQAMTLPDPDSECYAANGMTVAESNYPFHMLATIPCK